MDRGGLGAPAERRLPAQQNEIWSARVAHLARHAAQFGTATGPVATDMARFASAAAMVDREIDLHSENYKTRAPN